MPSIALHVSPREPNSTTSEAPTNPLPNFLQAPCGLAILELQATINLPPAAHPDDDEMTNTAPTETIPIGRLVFPDYNPTLRGEDDKSWMKRVFLYIGKHQRMTGEVKKLAKPLAVVRKREKDAETADADAGDELEIVEIVYWKLLFAMRPEPVGMEVEGVEEGAD